jgi:two-component system CheB/CheR fusion protein
VAAAVLSGMGSDGADGLRAVLARGGLALAQAPDSADFDPMPRAALAADRRVLSAAPGQIVQHLLDAWDPLLPDAEAVPGGEPAPDLAEGDAALTAVVQQVHRVTGHDFAPYKTSTLRRRSERRMGIRGVRSMAAYATLPADQPQEAELLFKEMPIGVTALFRDEAPACGRRSTEGAPARGADARGGREDLDQPVGCRSS